MKLKHLAWFCFVVKCTNKIKRNRKCANGAAVAGMSALLDPGTSINSKHEPFHLRLHRSCPENTFEFFRHSIKMFFEKVD